MDTISHALWGLGLFGFRGHKWSALIFGALPDLVSFAPVLVIQLVNGSYDPGPPPVESIPSWAIFNYDFSHSFVTAAVIITATWFINRGMAFAMLAWPFHILLDFPFHTGEYFPTKIFWPLSTFYFDGTRWASPWVWFPNLAGIGVLFLYRWISKKRLKHG